MRLLELGQTTGRSVLSNAGSPVELVNVATTTVCLSTRPFERCKRTATKVKTEITASAAAEKTPDDVPDAACRLLFGAAGLCGYCLYLRDKAIAPTMQSVDELRLVGWVVQSGPKLRDRDVDGMVDITVCHIYREFLLQVFPGNKLAGFRISAIRTLSGWGCNLIVDPACLSSPLAGSSSKSPNRSNSRGCSYFGIRASYGLVYGGSSLMVPKSQCSRRI